MPVWGVMQCARMEGELRSYSTLHSRCSTDMRSRSAQMLGEAAPKIHLRVLHEATRQQHVRAAHAARSKLWHRLPRPRLGHSARPPRTIVAQSSALMKDSSPLYTAKQFLARWRGAQMSIAQVGLKSCQALGRV